MTDEIKVDPEWPDEASYEHMAAEVLTVGQVRWFLRELDAGAIVLAAASAQTRAYLDRAEKAERERDEALEVLRRLVNHLDGCRRHERGAGGMSIEAQVQRSVLLDVREAWLSEPLEFFLAKHAVKP